MSNTTTPAARLTAIIAKATGATIDPILACPNVEADGALAFCADPTEAALIVAAMRDVHGVDGIAASAQARATGASTRPLAQMAWQFAQAAG